MTFLAPALPFLAAGASIVQGVGGLIAGKHNKKAAYRGAREELRASGEEQTEIRKDARRRIGALVAAQWGNGLEGGSGTAIDSLRESMLEAAFDVAEARRQGVSRAAALRSEGKASAREGYFAAASGILGAASAVHGINDDWAQARTGTSARPGS